jgi:hypothetical protein
VACESATLPDADNTNGAVRPVTVHWKAPVVALAGQSTDLPAASINVTVAPCMAAPVAATPLTVCAAGTFGPGDVLALLPESPPPQADRASVAKAIAMGVSFMESSLDRGCAVHATPLFGTQILEARPRRPHHSFGGKRRQMNDVDRRTRVLRLHAQHVRCHFICTG